MDNSEVFSVELRLDEYGDVQVGVSQEQFSPYVVVAMLEMAKQKVLAQFMMSVHHQRQAQQQSAILVPDSRLTVPR